MKNQLMREMIETGNIRIFDGDVFMVNSFEGMIANNLSIKYISNFFHTEETVSMPNENSSWEFLKWANESNRATVFIAKHLNNGNVEVVPFGESAPYKHRFNS